MDRWRGVEVVFAGLVATFTFALTVVSIGQWDVARHAVAESERAFVYASGVEFQPSDLNTIKPINQNSQAEVVLHITNSGNTPALSVTAQGNALPKKIDLGTFDFPDFSLPADQKQAQALIFIAPKQTIDIRFPISAVALVGAREQQFPIVIYGHIEYRDDVNEAQHRTMFCWTFSPHGREVSTSKGDVFTQCYRHNCTDGDCPEPLDWEPPKSKGESLPITATMPNELMASPIPNPLMTPAPTKRVHPAPKRHG